MNILSGITNLFEGQTDMQPIAGLDKALAAVAPKVDQAAWLAALTPPMRSSGITTPRRVAMFIGQCAHESAGFTTLSENTNYTHADRLLLIFPTHFKDLADAEGYAGNAVKIANRVYANRLGNGSELSGDGWRFRGAGIIQLTGRDTLARFAKATDSVGPESAAFAIRTDFPTAARAACWFWVDKGQLLQLSDAWDIHGVTRRVNGGLNGLDDRIALCTAALKAMPGPLT